MNTRSAEEQMISNDDMESVYEEIKDQTLDVSFSPKSTKQVKKITFFQNKKYDRTKAPTNQYSIGE